MIKAISFILTVVFAILPLPFVIKFILVITCGAVWMGSGVRKMLSIKTILAILCGALAYSALYPQFGCEMALCAALCVGVVVRLFTLLF